MGNCIATIPMCLGNGKDETCYYVQYDLEFIDELDFTKDSQIITTKTFEHIFREINVSHKFEVLLFSTLLLLCTIVA